MNFGEAIKSGFNKYVDFSGRSSRSETWWWVLFSLIANVVAVVLDGTVGSGLVGAIVTLGLFLPSLAVQVRRLHDLDRSGWWILISFVPIVGLILLVFWFCKKGTEGENRFGADPLT